MIGVEKPSVKERVTFPSPRLVPVTVTVSKRVLIAATEFVTPLADGAEPPTVTLTPFAATLRCICSLVSVSATDTTFPVPVRVKVNPPEPSGVNLIGAAELVTGPLRLNTVGLFAVGLRVKSVSPV